VKEAIVFSIPTFRKIAIAKRMNIIFLSEVSAPRIFIFIFLSSLSWVNFTKENGIAITRKAIAINNYRTLK